MKETVSLVLLPQPNEVTCGPTCLHSVYNYYEDDINLETVIKEVVFLEGGGTLDVLLGNHALKRGYDAHICTFNIQVFDPAWFYPKKITNEELCDKLKKQAEFKNNPKLHVATHAYCEFLELGGEITLEDLTRQLLRKQLKQKIPLLTGLSSTFLYRTKREYTAAMMPDDIRGIPEGHFVILTDYNEETKEIDIADPFKRNPYSADLKYAIHIDRVICAILLGILTYDANFLIISPKKERRTKEREGRKERDEQLTLRKQGGA